MLVPASNQRLLLPRLRLYALEFGGQPGHHYVIDVLLGILVTFIGIALLEGCIFRIPCIKRGLEKYANSIKNKPIPLSQTKEEQTP